MDAIPMDEVWVEFCGVLRDPDDGGWWCHLAVRTDHLNRTVHLPLDLGGVSWGPSDLDELLDPNWVPPAPPPVADMDRLHMMLQQAARRSLSDLRDALADTQDR
jgi:hypothetical protein